MYRIKQMVCPVCSKKFTSFRKNPVYCSRKCFSKRKPKSLRKCNVCGKTFLSYPNWIKRGGGKYCSWTCSAIAKEKNYTKRMCEICSTEFLVKPSTPKYSVAKYCSHACMNKAARGKERPHLRGENAPNWKGGASRELYPLKFNDELKDKIRKRDGYSCQICAMQDEEHILVYGYSLMVHHIDYIKENCEESNLISLCNQCHGRTNYNRAYWTDFLSSKMLSITGREK
jgi:hypothetical protein